MEQLLPSAFQAFLQNPTTVALIAFGMFCLTFLLFVWILSRWR